jgi:hypothetical protein
MSRLALWRSRHDGGRRGIVTRVVAFAEDRPAFDEGLALGAVVGAAIAGSTIWSRLRANRRGAIEKTARGARTPVPGPTLLP